MSMVGSSISPTSGVGAVPASAVLALRESRWIQSAGFDLALLVLSPLAGVAVLAASLLTSPKTGSVIVLAAFYLVGVPHYLSTYVFFLDRDNLAYYWSRRLAFFGGPLLIVASVLLLWKAHWYAEIQAAVFIWNIYHVSMQSSGILSVYRNLNGGPASEKRLASAAIVLANATMAFWFIQRYQPVAGLMGDLHPTLPGYAARLLLPFALIATGLLLYRLRHREGGVRTPEAVFLASSLLLFHPYLWVRDMNLATLGMLMGHFIQYLALVWLLNRRKYMGDRVSAAPQVALISRHVPLLLTALVLSGVVFWTVERTAAAARVQNLYALLIFALTFNHFYLDGLIWAFRRPFVRESIGPFLLQGQNVLTK